jgi:hypothetical protein
MLLKKYFLFVIVCAAGYAQTVYEIVPGSKNNLFELSLANNTKSNFQSVNVNVQEAPVWVEFSSNELSFNNIKTSEKQTAQFYFNISDNAPIGEETIIKFRITDNTNRSWFKSYNIKVTPPKVFEVYQNYPNPFNPSTTIKYSIPQDAFVTIKVFNVLGEEVSVLVNKEMKTGIHEVVFDATNLSSGFSAGGGYASGVYLYVVEAKGTSGTKYFDTKKMILLR